MSETTDYSRVSTILSMRRLLFRGSEAEYGAERLKDDQQRHWSGLLANLRSPDPATANLRQHLQNQIGGRGNSFKVEQVEDNGAALIGEIAVLTDSEVTELLDIAMRRPFLVWAAMAFECPALLQNLNATSHLSVQLSVEIMAYLCGGTGPKDMSKVFSSLSGQVDISITKAKNAQEAMEKRIEEDEKKVRDFVNEQKESIIAFQHALSEDIKLKASSSLWSARAIWYRSAVFLWFAVFAAGVGAILYYVVNHTPELGASLPKDPDGHYSYVSLAFLVIPALGAAWVLRLIARFINTNRLLADDARHRQAMTQAYLALVADKNSGVTEKDRLVMLTAMFRPLPGVQMEDVSPPTILDILKKET